MSSDGTTGAISGEGRQVQADEERKLAQDQQEQEGRESGSGTAGGSGNPGEPREDKGNEPGGGEVPQTVANTSREGSQGSGMETDMEGEAVQKSASKKWARKRTRRNSFRRRTHRTTGTGETCPTRRYREGLRRGNRLACR